MRIASIILRTCSKLLSWKISKPLQYGQHRTPRTTTHSLDIQYTDDVLTRALRLHRDIDPGYDPLEQVVVP